MVTADARLPGEGLRERKKRLLRELVSGTATAMFLERGFDGVTVQEIAEACEVSEKTVYNYFPTKESLLFDQEEHLSDLIRDSVRDRGDDVDLADAVVDAVTGYVEDAHRDWRERGDDAEAMATVRRFADLVESTPALQTAQQAMMDRLTDVAADALAERAGVDPEDPEPQLAAAVVVGLWRTVFRGMRRYAADDMTLDDLRDAQLVDVRRAAQVADSGLSSFSLVVRPGNTKQQLRDAADAANDARKQVVSAVKQARDVWRQVVTEMQAQHGGDAGWGPEGAGGPAAGGGPRSKAEWKRELRQRQREAQRELHRELRRQQAEMHRELRRQQADAARGRRGPGRGRS